MNSIIDPIRRALAKPEAISIAHAQLAELKRQELRYHAMLEEVQAALAATQKGITRLTDYIKKDAA